MSTLIRTRSDQTRRRKQRSRGQIVVIFAAAAIVFIGLMAIVVDVSWFWANSLRMQRAADAAALAGVVDLPGNEAGAIVLARAEASKNGFSNGTGGVVVTPWQDPTNDRRLRVTISGPIGTFFARVIGINSFPGFAQSKADYVLPVPMGSPENYYGVFGKIRHPGGGVTVVTTNTATSDPTTSYSLPTSSPSGSWSTVTNAYSSTDSGAAATTTSTTTPNSQEAYGNFGVTLMSTGTNTISGIEVEVNAKSSDNTGCTLGVELSWNGSNVGGAGWTSGHTQALTNTMTVYTMGSPGQLWGHSWVPSELTNANLRVRVTNIDPGASCTDNSTASVDYIRVRVTYHNVTTTTTSTFYPDVNVASPYGAALNPRGFWGTMLTEGAESINGDAYSPYYDTRTSGTNPNFDPTTYYDYAVEMPAGSSAGEVWLFDPGFCAVASDMGTGDRYFGNTNTNGSNEISAYYLLYDTKNTLYDASDDTLSATSGTTFANLAASDPSMNGPALSGGNLADCSDATVGSNTSNPEYYHNRWWQLASGLAGGTTYRVHVQSTDPANINAQKNMNGQNSFAIWTKATGGSPKVHGLGAMEAYTPLDPSTSAEFYLAQIGAEHAGKTMEIKLWDPGDTNSLSANLQIEIPTSAGYSAATLSYTAAVGTTNTGASSCGSTNVTGATTIPTNTGGSGGQAFQGCWVTILIPIPATYTAPTPPGEAEPGWWKIRYNMGSGSASAYDLTTWQVQIRGNPVHLVLP